jgi:membrane associated rhomboid family serine protease
MRRARRSSDLADAFTLGGRIPAAVGLLLAAILVASLGSWLAGGVAWAALLAEPIAGGQLWRLVTYVLVQQRPLDLLFAGIGVYFFAPPLVWVFGERRFLGIAATIAVGAAVLTLLLGWLVGVRVAYAGTWPLISGLLLLWSLRFPEQQVLLMFVVPVSGRVMGWITVGVTGLMVLHGVAVSRPRIAGLVDLAPVVAALGIAWLLAGGRLGIPRRWRLAWRDWQLERQHRRRDRRLQVVRRNGQGGPPSQWMN